MEYTHIRYSDHYYVYWFCECQSSTTGGQMVSKCIVWGEQSHAYIIKHPIETPLTPCDGIHSHQVRDITTCIVCECQSSTTGGQMSSNELCEGEQSHAYIIRHPISTQLTPCDGIHSHQVQWHYYVYWFCECQSSTTGGQMVSKDVWGRAVSCLHNQAPNWNTLTLVMDTLTSGTVTLLRVIDSVSARAAQLEDGLVSNELVWGRAVSCLHNQAPNLTQLTSCDGIHSHQVQWHYYLYDSVSARAGELGTDGLQMNCVGESSLMLT